MSRKQHDGHNEQESTDVKGLGRSSHHTAHISTVISCKCRTLAVLSDCNITVVQIWQRQILDRWHEATNMASPHCWPSCSSCSMSPLARQPRGSLEASACRVFHVIWGPFEPGQVVFVMVKQGDETEMPWEVADHASDDRLGANRTILAQVFNFDLVWSLFQVMQVRASQSYTKTQQVEHHHYKIPSELHSRESMECPNGSGRVYLRKGS